MDFLKANVTIISLIIAVTALVQPWLITLWKKFFRSPKIEIYPSGNLEIGYSGYGPTIGLHGTLHALHGDVFVKSIQLKVRRVQTNEEHWFAWAVFRSPVITFNPSESQPMELPAGFIVSQTQPHRYNIVFHDPDIQSEIRPYLEKLPPLAFSIGHKHNLDFVRGTINSQENDRSKKFIATIIREMELRMDEYLLDFPEDKEIEKRWEEIKSRLLAISLTKKRIRSLRSLWNNYRNNHKNWKRLLNDLSEFLEGKQAVEREEIMPYNPELLKLIAVDFVC